MSLRQKTKQILETSRLNSNEKLLLLGVLTNGSETAIGLYSYLGVSRSVISMLLDDLSGAGYLSIEEKRIGKTVRKVYFLTDLIFEEYQSRALGLATL